MVDRDKVQTSTVCVWLGAFLLVVSIPVVMLVAIEEHVARNASERYNVQLLGNDGEYTDVCGHRVVIAPTGTGTTTAATNVRHTRLTIDTRDWSKIPTEFHPQVEGRLVGTAVVRVQDLKTGGSFVAIAQCFRAGDDLSGRLIDLWQDGTVTQEVFTLPDRFGSGYRTLVMVFAADQPIGFFTNIGVGYPNLCFPILYPFVTSPTGFVLVLFGLALRYRRRRAERRAKEAGNE